MKNASPQTRMSRHSSGWPAAAQAKAEGLDVRVLMESTDKLTLIRRALYGPTLKPTVYHTYARITQRADELMAARPELMQRVQIGETTGRRQPIASKTCTCRKALVRWSSPRITWVTPMS